MMPTNLAIKRRLVLVGTIVVLSSIAISMGLAQLAFMVSGNSVRYDVTMFFSAVIPLVVASSTFVYISRLYWKVHLANVALDRLARRDGLTGLCNRRDFVEQATTCLQSYAPHQLVMLDLDHFKQINDTLGHAAGDIALQHTADILQAMAPPASVVARLGGEEFAVLLPAHTMPKT